MAWLRKAAVLKQSARWPMVASFGVILTQLLHAVVATYGGGDWRSGEAHDESEKERERDKRESADTETYTHSYGKRDRPSVDCRCMSPRRSKCVTTER